MTSLEIEVGTCESPAGRDYVLSFVPDGKYVEKEFWEKRRDSVVVLFGDEPVPEKLKTDVFIVRLPATTNRERGENEPIECFHCHRNVPRKYWEHVDHGIELGPYCGLETCYYQHQFDF